MTLQTAPVMKSAVLQDRPVNLFSDLLVHHMGANLADNIYHCFKCGAGGNALDLWVAATGQNVYDAAVDLCQRLGRPLPTKESTRRPAMASQQTTAEQRREPVGMGERIATT